MRGFYAKWLQDYEDAQCDSAKGWKPGCPGTAGAPSDYGQ